MSWLLILTFNQKYIFSTSRLDKLHAFSLSSGESAKMLRCGVESRWSERSLMKQRTWEKSYMNLLYQLIVNSIRAFQNIKSCLWSHHCMLASPRKFLKLLSWLKNDFLPLFTNWIISGNIWSHLATAGHNMWSLATPRNILAGRKNHIFQFISVQ